MGFSTQCPKIWHTVAFWLFQVEGMWELADKRGFSDLSPKQAVGPTCEKWPLILGWKEQPCLQAVGDWEGSEWHQEEAVLPNLLHLAHTLFGLNTFFHNSTLHQTQQKIPRFNYFFKIFISFWKLPCQGEIGKQKDPIKIRFCSSSCFLSLTGPAPLAYFTHASECPPGKGQGVHDSSRIDDIGPGEKDLRKPLYVHSRPRLQTS